MEYDIEWISDGLKISENRVGLEPCYTEENIVMKLSRVGRNSLVATDEIGTIRLFEYPCKHTGYYQLYSQHLNYINTCHISPDWKYLITSSRVDKCIFIWRIEPTNREEDDDEY
jgi:WD40 repeat protein